MTYSSLNRAGATADRSTINPHCLLAEQVDPLERMRELDDANGWRKKEDM